MRAPWRSGWCSSCVSRCNCQTLSPTASSLSAAALTCTVLQLSIIFMIASNAFEADNPSHQLIHSNHFRIPTLLLFFITFYLSKGDVITCIQGARLSSSFAPFLRSPAWFGFAFSLQWFSIGCQVISNFHFILNDQHHRHHHHRANQKCNFSNHLKKAPSFTWFIWGKHLLLLGLFEESTLFYLVYSKKAPCFTWLIWRKHLVLLCLFEESTLSYLVYSKEAPCFTWFIWRKHLVLLG